MPLYPGKANSPKTELTAAITATDTTIPVADVSKLPVAPNICTLINGETSETIFYNAVSGNTLTGVTRGLDGTTAKGWAIGQKVARTFTNYDWQNIIDSIPKAATTTQAGIVQLSTALTSTDDTKAATSGAVKKANDAAAAANTAAGTAEKNAKEYADTKKLEIVNTGLVGKPVEIVPPTDFNAAMTAGQYQFVAGAVIANEPMPGNSGRRINLKHEIFAGSVVLQTLHYLVGQFSGMSFWRSYEGGWSSWRMITSGMSYVGNGTPEGVITAPSGATYSRLDGGVGTSYYVKESGGNTGWKAK